MKQRWITIAVWTLSIVAMLAIVSSYAGRLWSGFDLVAHLRLALAYATIGVFFLALLARRRGPAWIAGLASGVNLVPIAMLYIPPTAEARSPAPADAQVLRILQFNVHWSNRRLDDVVTLVRNSAADLVVLQESMPKVIAAMVAEGSYRFVLSDLDPDNPKDNGSSFFVRHDSPVVIEASSMTRPLRSRRTNGWLEVQVRFAGDPLTLIVGRMLPPKTKQARKERGPYTRALHEMLARAPGEVVVIGDLNETPFGSVLTEWCAETRLVDSARGFGYAATWPVSGWKSLIGIPIDHVLHSPGLATIDRRVLPDAAGSDHYPVVVDLVRRSPTTR